MKGPSALAVWAVIAWPTRLGGLGAIKIAKASPPSDQTADQTGRDEGTVQP